jgi:hypothetical protein
VEVDVALTAPFSDRDGFSGQMTNPGGIVHLCGLVDLLDCSGCGHFGISYC